MKLYRDLGYSEVLTKSINDVTPHNIVVTGVIDGIIAPAYLRQAVDFLQKINPLLKTAILYDESFKFFYSPDIGAIPIDFVQADVRDSCAQLEELMSLQLSVNEKLPLIRLVCIADDEKTFLALVVQHTIADGVSAINLYLELVRIIDSILSRTLVSVKEKTIKPSLEECIFGDTAKIQALFIDKRQHNEKIEVVKRWTGCSQISVPKNYTQAIVDYSKKNGISVTSVVAGLLIYSLLDNSTDTLFDSIFYNIMINLRGHMGRDNRYSVFDNDIGFYSGCLPLVVENVARFGLSALCMNVHHNMKNAINMGQHVEMTRGYKNLIRQSNTVNDFINNIKVDRPTVGLSNMGVIHDVGFNHFNLDDLNIACNVHAYSRTQDTFFVCMNTYKNKMYLNFLHPMPIFSKERIDKVIQTFHYFLADIGKWYHL